MLTRAKSIFDDFVFNGDTTEEDADEATLMQRMAKARDEYAKKNKVIVTEDKLKELDEGILIKTSKVIECLDEQKTNIDDIAERLAFMIKENNTIDEKKISQIVDDLRIIYERIRQADINLVLMRRDYELFSREMQKKNI